MIHIFYVAYLPKKIMINKIVTIQNFCLKTIWNINTLLDLDVKDVLLEL